MHFKIFWNLGHKYCNKNYLFSLGLFFSGSLFWLSCFHIAVLFTSSEIFIAVRGIFITFPFANGIFKLLIWSSNFRDRFSNEICSKNSLENGLGEIRKISNSPSDQNYRTFSQKLYLFTLTTLVNKMLPFFAIWKLVSNFEITRFTKQLKLSRRKIDISSFLVTPKHIIVVKTIKINYTLFIYSVVSKFFRHCRHRLEWLKNYNDEQKKFLRTFDLISRP